ncbi:glycerol-3-phosphate dehydrogenase/oxidase [Undibacterium sp. SXout11W]|uniref:glycerol-3-phosphate dehydrogenase/oxidase n=1 Tax=Undibacterium sp. SXout11W TaxID=3413050 RepID=UPI003BF42B85
MASSVWDGTERSDLDAVLSNHGRSWDLVVIGGGITGAGILLEAARRGLKALLIEQRDFAWGTSSRSSKLVHGGLRYLKEGKFHLTRDSVRERQALMQDAHGLVDHQSFAFADYQGRKPGRWMFALGLAIYDKMARQTARHYFPTDEFLMMTPHIGRQDLKGGLSYHDAKTDDARLVMRVLQEAKSLGATAINYLAASKIDYVNELAQGVQANDTITGQDYQIRARSIINATGAWADRLRLSKELNGKIRPLRGSHLLMPGWRLPVAQAVSLMHPRDGRPVFVYPWEGVTLVGTTDVDHHADLQTETAITPDEVTYLMEALAFQFPSLALGLDDIIATYAGVRPVIDTGKADPSKEGRDHAVWMEKGLLTVTGGKLTTFRLIALDALKNLAPLLPEWRPDLRVTPLFDNPRNNSNSHVELDLPRSQRDRLFGHYGRLTPEVIAAAHKHELERIPGTETMWVELRWAARYESVLQLEDLLLRRTRLGLLLKNGGVEYLPRIRSICQSELKWDDTRWNVEQAAYLELWQKNYALPAKSTIKDWLVNE